MAPATARVAADPHSFGNPDQIRVHHVLLDLTVDFEHRILKGSAVLDIVRQPGCPADAPLVLDTRGLTIEEVGLRKMEPTPQAFTPTTFHLDPPDPILGSRLTIKLSPSANQVRIQYQTAPTAGALAMARAVAHGG